MNNFEYLSDESSQDMEFINECRAKLKEIDKSIEGNTDKEYEVLLLAHKDLYQQAIYNCKQEIKAR